MHRELTVLEILTFSAQTRLQKRLSAEEIEERVESTLIKLGLYDIQHSTIGDETKRGISGGQRKRVNIGIEMVADPSVLFLDEPTSGLDSTSSKEVCHCLRTISREGVTISTVIHQPRYDIFEMFDQVLLLGKGGHTVYLGPSKQALRYFEDILAFDLPAHANPADFFMDVISGSEKPRVPVVIKSKSKSKEEKGELAGRRGEGGEVRFDPSSLFEFWTENGAEFLASVNSRSSVVTRLPAGSSIDPNSSVWDEAMFFRETAGFRQQLMFFFKRGLIQITRSWNRIIFNLVLATFTGLFLGLIYFGVFYQGPGE